MKTVVITGVSSGIGYNAAETLLQNGFRVFGSVRTVEDGARVKAELGDQFMPLLFDVTDRAAIETAVSQVSAALNGRTLDGLINNAGIAVPGPLNHLPVDQLQRQLDINIIGVFNVTQAFIPLLGADEARTGQPGRIVNISSVSGKIAYPFMGAYAASKHGLEALSDAWRRELLLYGIDLILIEPGTVKTPIIGKFREQVIAYLDTPYGKWFEPLTHQIEERNQNGMEVSRVGTAVLTALTHPRPKTRYPLPNRRWTGWWLPRFLPDRWFDRIVARRLGINR